MTYDLDDVWLLPDITDPNTGTQQMTGRVVWTYTVGDFENGTGEFSDLYIPFSGTAIGPLDIVVETKSMEFVLQDDFHDLGVDVSLKLTGAFTEDAGATVDVVLSKWQVEVGTITSGHIISGSVIPTCWSPVNYGSGSPGSGGFTPHHNKLGRRAAHRQRLLPNRLRRCARWINGRLDSRIRTGRAASPWYRISGQPDRLDVDGPGGERNFRSRRRGHPELPDAYSRRPVARGGRG